MKFTLQLISDFGDFTKGSDLGEWLKRGVSNVRLSPDGHHIHVVNKPKPGLLTFDRLLAPHPTHSHKHVELTLKRTVPVVDLVYLAADGADSPAVGLVFESGRAEFWEYRRRKAGWHLLQSSDLCNSSTAKVTSVCATGRVVAWCEERPPSGTSAASASPASLQYCICTRTYELDSGGLSLGGIKIALHNNPRLKLSASGDVVYLLPDVANEDAVLPLLSKFFMSWSSHEDVLKVHTTWIGTVPPPPTLRDKESDFRKIVCSCVGTLASIDAPELRSWCPTGDGGLVLLLASGWVSLLSVGGFVRRAYKLADNCVSTLGNPGGLGLYGDKLAVIADRNLFVIDTNCGLELQKIPLERETLLFKSAAQPQTPHLLSAGGLYALHPTQNASGSSPTISPTSFLVEAVFEEACKFYQQRSLSNTQLTVEKLKTGGMFQAPFVLSALIKDFLGGEKVPESDVHQKLLKSLDTELKNLLALEKTKVAMLSSSEKEVEGYCEKLVLEEIQRLLSGDLDRENVLYLNTVFNKFPSQSWQAVLKVFQLRCNGEGDGSLSANASPEVWRSVLNPVPPAPAASSSSVANVALPVFELLCRSLLRFRPSWLPRFLALAQERAGWSYSVQESAESLPLYRRALAMLPQDDPVTDPELEVEILLCSQRPNAVMQALRLLMERQQWSRVNQVAHSFSHQSPLLNKEIFTALLREVSSHRHLDAYLDLLWTLCPEDMSVTTILNIVLKNLPPTNGDAAPFQPQGDHLTIGILRPLLSRVLQRETKPSHRYADILQSPSFPPPTPPRLPKELTRSSTEPILDQQDSTMEMPSTDLSSAS